jgi:hypothetical protein
LPPLAATLRTVAASSRPAAGSGPSPALFLLLPAGGWAELLVGDNTVDSLISLLQPDARHSISI